MLIYAYHQTLNIKFIYHTNSIQTKDSAKRLFSCFGHPLPEIVRPPSQLYKNTKLPLSCLLIRTEKQILSKFEHLTFFITLSFFPQILLETRHIRSFDNFIFHRAYLSTFCGVLKLWCIGYGYFIVAIEILVNKILVIWMVLNGKTIIFLFCYKKFAFMTGFCWTLRSRFQ